MVPSQVSPKQIHLVHVCVISMKQLRERVFKLREDCDHIYHLNRSEGKPSINWGNMMDEKLVGGTCVSLPHTVLL